MSDEPAVQSRLLLPVIIAGATTVVAIIAIVVLRHPATSTEQKAFPSAGRENYPPVIDVSRAASALPSLLPATDPASPGTAGPGQGGGGPVGGPATTRPPVPPPTTAAAPKPFLTTAASGKCVWNEGHGWTIVVSSTVHNGTGVSANGTHGWDPNVGKTETFGLSRSGNTFSGELPPNLGGNPELTGPSVTWSVQVALADGTTVSDSGSLPNPC